MQIGSKIIYIDKTNSTNNYLKNNLEKGLVVYTDEQTSGRGQRTNKWESEAAKNILMSTALFHESLKAENQFFLSKAISLAVYDFLSEYIIDVKIKWPNDIYIYGKKIAGILIENNLRGANIYSSVVGIGININQVHFPAYLPNPTSLSSITGKTYEPKKLLNELIKNLNIRYHQLEKKQYKKLSASYFQHLYRFKIESEFLIDKIKVKAKIIDIEDDGKLVLQYANNSIKSYAFKEIEFINE
ncbi:MAG: biotin--[acetyl-CoA-carboxylase] ligase [Bacteroidales bacterium]|nr:biotin--[acetyl-CoA-carboxylase] ligase [Bacteroidales bacterium]